MAETLASRLVMARARAGYSQNELEELTGIAQTQLSRYESGRSIPRRAAVEKLASALGVAPTWLSLGIGEATQLLVTLKGKDGLLHPTLVADETTNQEFLQMAAGAGASPDEFLRMLMVEHLEKVSEAGREKTPSTESRLSAMGRKIDNLEKQLAAMTGNRKLEK